MLEQICITEKAYRQIQDEVNRHPGEETGGILVGFRTPDALVVTSGTGPGPKAVHMPNSIQFDEKYCLRKAEQIQKFGKFIHYIGDWHSHPYTKLKPSKIDKRSFQLKSFTHYRTPNPLMVITGPGPLVPLQAFLLNKKLWQATPQLIDNTTLSHLKKQAISF